MLHYAIVTFLRVTSLATSLEPRILILELRGAGNGNHTFEKDFPFIPSRTVVDGKTGRGSFSELSAKDCVLPPFTLNSAKVVAVVLITIKYTRGRTL